MVDESQIGMGEHPSVFADEFIAQQSMAQQQMHEEKSMEIREKQQMIGALFFSFVIGLAHSAYARSLHNAIFTTAIF